MLGKVVYAAAVLVIVLVALTANSPRGRRWLEERADTIRWFTNEVKTLKP